MKKKSLTLNTPFQIGKKLTVKNRFFKSAMSEQLTDKNNLPNKELIKLYETWAEGGLGISVTGNVMIDKKAMGEPRQVVLEKDTPLESFKAWAKAGTKNDCQLWMQLNHPGKQIPSILCKEPVAPSAISLGAGLEKAFNPPRALSEPEILDIIERFANSSKLAKEAGFSGVQIHGAHGYLVSQFLSSRHNQRTDQWGGRLENRMRFVLEVYRAIRTAVGDFPIGIKLNSADFMKGGFTEEESMEVVKTIAKEGIDMIEISGGTYESPSMTGHKIKESTKKREAYFLDYAEKVRSLVDTPIAVTGGFRSGTAMTEALQSGATDMIGVARPLAVEPDLPNKIIEDPTYAIHMKKLSTGIKAVDRMAMLEITWYEHQLHLIGKGKAPKKYLNEWISVLSTVKGLGIQAFKKRRA
ncbi:MAG: 2,4-dienoyl-CoA reductase-like NADH-dependent reductase (Old Yellow Enzyme family) [bacterium]|jgi:2,4-dienoyl-CoA reductase-like NADH-dependent reductase (Old Yellow Enzyme family)